MGIDPLVASLAAMPTVCRCVAILVTLSVAGCGSSKPGTDVGSTSVTQTVQQTTTGTRTSPHPASDTRRLQVHAVARDNPKKSAFGASARLSGPGTLQVLLRPSREQGTSAQRLTISRPNPQTMKLVTTPSGGGKAETSTVRLADESLKIDRLVYGCQLPPKTFCPLRRVSREGQRVTLTTKGGRLPVLLSVVIQRKTTDATARLAPLGPSSPGSPVTAVAQVTRLATKADEKGTPLAAEVRAGAGASVRVLVRAAKGSPADGALRIAVPRMSGQTIEVRAGGVASRPASTAKIVAFSGRLRVAQISYTCGLPPATFCPLKPVAQNGKRVVFRIPTPRVPVVLTFKLAAA